MRKPKAPTQQERLWEIEKQVNLTVISADSRLCACADCKRTRLIFNSHAFREEARPIVSLCKECTIRRAGGRDKVHVREEAYLQQKWEKDGLLKAPPARAHGGRNAVRVAEGSGGHGQ